MKLRRPLVGSLLTACLLLTSSLASAASPRTLADILVPDPRGVLNLQPGYQYKEVINWKEWLAWGQQRGVDLRSPDGNFYIPLPEPLADGTAGYLYTNHERDKKTGSVTRLALDASFSMIGEPQIVLSGLNRPCSGNLTPWGTLLIGEEATEGGYVWEIDLVSGAARPIHGLGRYSHETAVVDPRTGDVYSTDDGYDPVKGRGMIYKFVPDQYGDLSSGKLFALDAANRRWVEISDPENAPAEAAAHGASPYMKPEDAELGHDGWLYVAVTETDKDGVHWGRVIRIHPESLEIQDFVAGSKDGMTMPDNLAFDRTGNLYIVEDSNSTNQVLVAQPSGKFRPFAEIVRTATGKNASGPWFTPDYKALFLNLMSDDHRTVVITGF